MLDKVLNARVVNELKQIHLFEAMDESQFGLLLMCSRIKNIQADSMLFQQGDNLTHIYYVFDGAIKLCRSTRKGDEKIIEVVQSGKTFAEGVLFGGAPKYPVSAIAMKNSMVVSIDANKFLNILKKSNSLCINMLGHLSQRLHWMLKELDKQTLHNASFRMVDYFLNQTEVDDDCVSYSLSLTIPKRDIASRLSIKPETFSRALKSLLKKGLIEINDNQIVLKDVRQLRKMVELEEI